MVLSRPAKFFTVLFPALFMAELFLGFNGAQLVLFGLSIRKLLFVLAAATLFLAAAAQVKKRGLHGLVRRIDLLPLCFLALNLLWMTAVPLAAGTSLRAAFDDAGCLFVLALYFPVSMLVRAGVYRMQRIEQLVLGLSTALAVEHLVFYVCGRIDMSFGIKFFEFLHRLSGGTSVIQQVILGENYVRVIFPTTVLLLPGLYVLLRRWRRLTPWDGVCAALLLTAVFTTMTRSLWIGVAVSFVLFAVLYGALCVKNRRRFLKVMLAGLAVLAVAVTALNFLVFDGNLFGRLTGNENPQIPGQSTQRPEEENARQVQTQALLEKFSHRPVLGYGYGSYAQDCIRSEAQPYSYEMFLPALLMKTGVLGTAVWAATAGLFLWLSFRKNRQGFPAVCFLSLSFFLMFQTNPFLFNFCGMGLLCFLFLTWNGQEPDGR